MVLCKMDKILYNLSLLAKVEGVVSNQWTGLDYWTDHFTTKIHFQISYPAIRPDQFDFSFHRPDRPKILGIQKKKRKKKRCGNAWPNCSRSWLQPALTSMFSSAIIRPRTIVK